jgi:hypothetical protein
LNHFTVPRAIVDLPTDDPADIILIGGLAANDFVPQPSAASTTVEITPIQRSRRTKQ